MKKLTIFSIVLLMLSFSLMYAQDKSAYKKVPAKISSIEQMTPQVKSNSDFDKNSRAKDYTSYTEDQWDLLLNVDVEAATGYPSAGGAETDGNYFYVSKWNGAEIHKFDMDGNYIETFTISGVSGLRDLAYDGTYFYGGANSTTIYEMDFDNKTLISTFTSPRAVRAIAYDDDLDGFYVNNWDDDMDISLIDRDGNVLNTFTNITSQYGMAYDNVSDGGPYLWCFTGTNGAPDPAQIEQFDLANGTYTGVMHSVTDDMGSSLAGGLFTYEANGLYLIGGLNQGESEVAPLEPNKLFVYELETLVTYDHDMAVSGFVSPLSGYDLTASEVVEIKIKNKGNNAESGFMVSYSVDGGAAVEETYSGSIAAGEEVTYAFTTTADLSGFADYEIVATVALSNDQNTGNDSKSTVVVNEPAPSQVTVYPMNVDYWTGSTDGVTKTETSLTHALGNDVENGWMIFDLSSLPPGATVNWAEISVYVYDTYYPYWSITPMSVDPLTADAATIFNEAEGNTASDVAYSYNNESSSFAAGWHTYTLENSAPDDIANAAGGAFAVGVASRDGSTSYWVKIEGQAETNVPYILIDYNEPMADDAGVVSILLPGVATPGSYVPKAVVKNFSGNTMSFPVTMTIDGYNSTKNVTDLPAGQQVEVTFDEWNATVGTYTAEVCTEATGDPVADNNCMSKSVSISDLTQAYAYVAYDPSSTLPEGPATFMLQSPDQITSLAATTSDQFICAGAWGNDTWYGFEYYDATAGSGGKLYTIDPNTGAMTAVGGGGVGINGIAFDHTTNTLFGIGAAMLYEINVSTGAATEVAAISNSETFLGLACSPEGVLYSYTGDDNFYMVDKNTGQVTFIGTVGFDVYYAQDMEFDLNSGILYLAAYNNTLSAGELRTVDLTTGASTLIGTFANDSEICGFAIPGEAGPVSGFMADIMVMDAGGATETANTLTIGTADDATDGLDAQYNELELPPVPPAGVFDARFMLPGNVASLVDVRSTENEEITWTMNFQPGDAGYPVTLSWDPMDLGAGSFMLVDGVTGGSIFAVDMKSTDSYVISNSSMTQVKIMYSEAITMQFDMLGGWNIVSVPVEAADMTVASLFPDATSDAFAFNSGYTSVEEMEGGAGYWLKMADAGTHSVSGMAMSGNVTLNAGWNIIGPYHYEMDVENIATNPAGIITSDFFGFNAGYFSAEGLMPGHGYWVKASAAGEIVMGMAKNGEEADAPDADALYTIAVATSDGADGSYALVLGIDPAATAGIDGDLDETELPPLPPAGVYDARMILPDGTTGSPADYRTGDANFTGQITYTMKYQLGDGATGMTLNVSIPEVPGTVVMTVKDPFGGSVVNEVINEGGGQVVVTNTSLTELKLIVDYNAPIPVELSSFAANVVGETIQLAWETATETNNKGFEVERSEDGQTFTQIGYIDGNGTTSEKHAYSYTDHHATSGTYFYRLRQVDFDGTASYSDAVEVEFIPTEYSLGQNYPNPFNPTTKVKFAVPVESKVTVTLYNMLGQKVKEVVSAQYNVGLHEVELNASDLASGMYIYNITAQGVDGSNFVDTKKMMLMK